jgi:hypothetical protein
VAAAVQDGLPGVLPAYRGTVDAVRTIVAREGWLGLYAGLAPSMLGSSEGGGQAGACQTAAVVQQQQENSKDHHHHHHHHHHHQQQQQQQQQQHMLAFQECS